MKYFLILFSLYLIASSESRAQITEKKIPFVLLIDNDVPIGSNIRGEAFIILDSVGHLVDSIPFKYQVGVITLTQSNYQKLTSGHPHSKIKIQFVYRRFLLPDNNQEEFNYEKILSWQHINDVYMILKVFNYFNKQSRENYSIKKNSYAIEVDSPGWGDVIATKRKIIK